MGGCLASSYGLWRKRNRREIEGIENDFVQLRNSLLSLIDFWCTCEIPICIDEGLSFVENHVLTWFLYFVVYLWYTRAFPNFNEGT